MKVMLGLMAMAAGLGAARCGSEGNATARPKCQLMVLEDTTQVYVSGDRVMVARKDTLPKPYSRCLTLYASARDTLPKP